MKESEIKRGDIFFADLDPGVGSEQLGIRPCIIIQNDVGNHFSTTTISAPSTSRTKKTLPTHVPVSIRLGRMPKESIALLEQIRAVDKSRLLAYIGHADKKTMSRIEAAAECSLGLDRRQEETDRSTLTVTPTKNGS